jgi:hypothetical protein
LNVLGTLLIGLSVVAGSSVLAGLASPAGSVEVRLVPIDPAMPTAPVATAVARVGIPPEYQTPDLAIRPWDVLPDGSVRMRD